MKTLPSGAGVFTTRNTSLGNRTSAVSVAVHLMMPWWACCRVTKVCGLPWSAKAVLSIIMARLAALKKAAEGEDDLEAADDWFWLHLENLGGEDRFRFSLDLIERETGLHRETIVDAKRLLAKLGIIKWTATDTADVLFPREAFRVVETPAPEGRVFIAFSRGSDSGQ